MMYLRISRMQSPREAVEGASASFKQVLPAVRRISGNLGGLLMMDRESGAARAVTFWESKQALDASERAAADIRAQAAREMGASVVDVERYEVVLNYRKAPPAANTFVRVNTLAARSAEGLDAGIAFTRDTVQPVLDRTAGFRALVIGLDREHNRSMLASIWESAAAREASEARIAGLRRQAAEAAGAQVTVERFEVVVAETSLPAAASA